MSGSRSGGEGSRGQEHVSNPSLAAFAEGALSQDEMRAISAHVAECDQCAARAAVYAEVDTLLREASMPPTPPALQVGLYARIQAAQATQTQHASTRHRRSELETIMLSNDFHGDHHGDHHVTPTITAPSMTTSQRHWAMRRITRWTSAVAALIIVGLMAGLFAAHHRQGQGAMPGLTPAVTATAPQQPCASSQIQATLPPLAGLSNLVMTGPNEGWAIGSVADSDMPGATYHSLILRYQTCRWAPYGDSLADTILGGLTMVSPNEGWATGVQSGKPLLLHYTGGNWSRVTPPNLGDIYDIALAGALPDGEVWIAGRTPQGRNTTTGEALLHLSAGQWKRVDLPVNEVYSGSVAGPDNLWLAGGKYPDHSTQIIELVNVRGAAAPTEYPVAQGTQLSFVHMLSPTDGWAAGTAYVSGNETATNPTIVRPVALHFDGMHWTEVNIGAPPEARLLDVSAGEAWSYTSPLNQVPQFVTSTQQEHAGEWTTIPWPFKRVIELRSLTCVTLNDCWAIGDILLPDKTQSDGHGGTIVVKGFEVALYHYANGAWSEYGRQN